MKKKLAGKYFFEWLGRNHGNVPFHVRKKWSEWAYRAYMRGFYDGEPK